MRRSLYFILLISLTYAVAIVSTQADQQVIQVRIVSTQDKIKSLEGEIAGYTDELNKTQEEKNTLSGAIKILDTTDKKLVAEISLTTNQIVSLESSIDYLASSIDSHSEKIARFIDSLSRSIRDLSQVIDKTLPEVILSQDTLSSANDSAY